MKPILTGPRQRHAVRREVSVRGQAVALDGFRLISEELVDLSAQGTLVRCDRPVRLGADVVVSFRVSGGPWFDAEAKVARVVPAPRLSERGYYAGLEFTHLEPGPRRELGVLLQGRPPPAPRQPIPVDYAESVRDIRLAEQD